MTNKKPTWLERTDRFLKRELKVPGGILSKLIIVPVIFILGLQQGVIRIAEDPLKQKTIAKIEPKLNEPTGRMFAAAKASDWDGLKEALINGADLNARDENGTNIIMQLAFMGRVKPFLAGVTCAVGEDENLRSKDKWGNDALDYAEVGEFIFAGKRSHDWAIKRLKMMEYFQRKDELLPKEILPFKSEFRKEFEYICRMVIGKQAKEKVVPKRPSKGQMYAQEFRTGFMKPSGAIMPKKN